MNTGKLRLRTTRPLLQNALLYQVHLCSTLNATLGAIVVANRLRLGDTVTGTADAVQQKKWPGRKDSESKNNVHFKTLELEVDLGFVGIPVQCSLKFTDF